MWKLKLMWVMWPAFLAAGVLEMLVFAVIDPEDMRWMGQSLAWPRQAVYSVGFFVLWGLTAIASSLSLMLSRSSESVNLAGEAVKREEVR
ncbi:MAG: hypothetical protein RL739_2788 [Pseudomonadota bacterium]